MDAGRSSASPFDVATFPPDVAQPLSPLSPSLLSALAPATMRDRVTAHAALRERIVFDPAGRASVRHGEARLSSGFSRLADVTDPGAPRVFGRRALLRIDDRAGERVPADVFFGAFGNDVELIDVDRLGRALHVLNFAALAASGVLFLPVQPRLLKSIRYDHGRYFADLLLSLGVNPASIVIEIPAVAAAHRTFLAYLVDSYRRHGFKVAAHVAGAAAILALQTGKTPHFVMIDARRALRDAMVAPLLAFAAHHGVCAIFTCVDGPAALALLHQQGVRFIDAGDDV